MGGKAEDSVYEVLEMMAEKNIGAVLVMKGGALVGVFSERDYARNTIQDERSAAMIPVCDLMTSDVICIDSSRTVEDCLALMTAKRIRHLPVLERDRLIGILTIGDVVKKVIEEQKFKIDELARSAAGAKSDPPKQK